MVAGSVVSADALVETMFRLVQALAALSFAAVASACTSQSTWDYLMLVMQWPPTECMSQNYGCSTYSQFFTLHGKSVHTGGTGCTVHT